MWMCVYISVCVIETVFLVLPGPVQVEGGQDPSDALTS